MPTEVRKVVTVVFCDLADSTNLGEQLDPESLHRVMARYYEEMALAVERHGGTTVKFIGDAVMAVFGMPVVHENDALRAVRSTG
jgi:class 3 adenylate cyclase